MADVKEPMREGERVRIGKYPHVLSEVKYGNGAPDRRLLNGGLNDGRAITVFDDRERLLKISSKNNSYSSKQQGRRTDILKEAVHSFDGESEERGGVRNRNKARREDRNLC